MHAAECMTSFCIDNLYVREYVARKKLPLPKWTLARYVAGDWGVRDDDTFAYVVNHRARKTWNRSNYVDAIVRLRIDYAKNTPPLMMRGWLQTRKTQSLFPFVLEPSSSVVSLAFRPPAEACSRLPSASGGVQQSLGRPYSWVHSEPDFRRTT